MTDFGLRVPQHDKHFGPQHSIGGSTLYEEPNSQPGTVQIDLRTLQELLKCRSEYAELREKALMDRMDLRHSRKDLKEKRLLASDKEAEFISKIRILWQNIDSVNAEPFSDLYEQTIAARDVYGALESDYNEAEMKYEQKERAYNDQDFELSDVETSLFGPLERLEPGNQGADTFVYHGPFYDATQADALTGPPQLPLAAPPLPPSWPRLLPRTLHSTSLVLPQDTTAVNRDSSIPTTQERESKNRYLQDYSFNIGRINMLKERLSELQSEYTELSDTESRRKTTNIELPPGDRQFLEDFPQQFQETQKELREATEHADEIRKHIPNVEAETVLGERRASESNAYLDPGALAVHAPAETRAVSESGLQTMIDRFRSTRERINEWILEALQGSRLEILRHKILLNRKDLDNDEWLHLVKKCWGQNADSDDDLLVNLKRAISQPAGTFSVAMNAPASKAGSLDIEEPAKLPRDDFSGDWVMPEASTIIPEFEIQPPTRQATFAGTDTTKKPRTWSDPLHRVLFRPFENLSLRFPVFSRSDQ